MISNSCKYAIRATVFIASQSVVNVKPGVTAIAEEIETPPVFRLKSYKACVNTRSLRHIRAPMADFFCVKYQPDLPGIDIENAIDSVAVFKECMME